MRKPPCGVGLGSSVLGAPLSIARFRLTSKAQGHETNCHALMAEFSTVQFLTQDGPSLLLKRRYPRVPARDLRPGLQPQVPSALLRIWGQLRRLPWWNPTATFRVCFRPVWAGAASPPGSRAVWVCV